MKFLGLILFLLVIGGCTVQQKSNVAANGSSNSSAGNSSASANKNPENTAELPKPEPAQLTPAQQAIADKATEAKWEEQGISWRLPAGWTKVSGDAPDRTLEYRLPDKSVFMVLEMPAEDPQESMKTSYDMVMRRQSAGKYENVKMTDVDGIPGLEFTETTPEEKNGSRGHHWVGVRSYKGKNQQIHVTVYTDSGNYDKHADEFQAILYSMKAAR